MIQVCHRVTGILGQLSTLSLRGLFSQGILKWVKNNAGNPIPQGISYYWVVKTCTGVPWKTLCKSRACAITPQGIPKTLARK